MNKDLLHFTFLLSILALKTEYLIGKPQHDSKCLNRCHNRNKRSRSKIGGCVTDCLGCSDTIPMHLSATEKESVNERCYDACFNKNLQIWKKCWKNCSRQCGAEFRKCALVKKKRNDVPRLLKIERGIKRLFGGQVRLKVKCRRDSADDSENESKDLSASTTTQPAATYTIPGSFPETSSAAVNQTKSVPTESSIPGELLGITERVSAACIALCSTVGHCDKAEDLDKLFEEECAQWLRIYCSEGQDTYFSCLAKYIGISRGTCPPIDSSEGVEVKKCEKCVIDCQKKYSNKATPECKENCAKLHSCQPSSLPEKKRRLKKLPRNCRECIYTKCGGDARFESSCDYHSIIGACKDDCEDVNSCDYCFECG